MGFTSSAGTDVIRPVSTWVPTNSLVTWSGLRVLAQNTNGAILFPNPSLQQVVTLSISVDVQFRQPQLSNTPTSFVSGEFFAPCECESDILKLEKSVDQSCDGDHRNKIVAQQKVNDEEDDDEPLYPALEEVDPPKYKVEQSARIFN